LILGNTRVNDYTIEQLKEIRDYASALSKAAISVNDLTTYAIHLSLINNITTEIENRTKLSVAVALYRGGDDSSNPVTQIPNPVNQMDTGDENFNKKITQLKNYDLWPYLYAFFSESNSLYTNQRNFNFNISFTASTNQILLIYTTAVPEIIYNVNLKIKSTSQTHIGNYQLYIMRNGYASTNLNTNLYGTNNVNQSAIPSTEIIATDVLNVGGGLNTNVSYPGNFGTSFTNPLYRKTASFWKLKQGDVIYLQYIAPASSAVILQGIIMFDVLVNTPDFLNLIDIDNSNNKYDVIIDKGTGSETTFYANSDVTNY